MEENAMKKKILAVLTMCVLFFCGSMNVFSAGGRNYVDQNKDGVCDFYRLSGCIGKFCGGLKKSGLRVQSAMQTIKDSNVVNVEENIQNAGNDNGAYVAEEVSYQCPVCGAVHEGSCIYGDGTCADPVYDGSYGRHCGNGMGNGNGAGMGHHGHGRHGR